MNDFSSFYYVVWQAAAHIAYSKPTKKKTKTIKNKVNCFACDENISIWKIHNNKQNERERFTTSYSGQLYADLCMCLYNWKFTACSHRLPTLTKEYMNVWKKFQSTVYGSYSNNKLKCLTSQKWNFSKTLCIHSFRSILNSEETHRLECYFDRR